MSGWNPSSKLTGGVLTLVFLGLIASPISYSKDDSRAVASAKPAARDLPVKNIFDTQNAKVEAVADSLEYQKDSGKLIARGNAVITYQGNRILADYAEVDTNAKTTYAKGHVMIFKGDVPMLQGKEVYYDFGKHTGSFPNARAISEPWFARGEDIRQIREGVDKIQKGGVTTCNLEKPHYEIRCKKATLYTHEKLIMYSATLYVLGKPVLWLPWMDVPLNWPSIPIQAQVGYSTQYGAYLRLTKGVTFNKHLWGNAFVDWRSLRGFGGGWNQHYSFGKYAQGSVKLYLTRDRHAPTPGYVNPANGAANPYAQREDRLRGRVTWRHRTDINEHTNVFLRYQRISDAYLLKDFFEKEYRAETQQHSFVTGTHNSERYGTMVHLEKHMNSFESDIERMPEVRLDWKNQPFFTDKVFNESRVQFDNLNKIDSGISSNPAMPHTGASSHTAVRTDAYSRWYVPLKWNDISFMPFAGYRGTEYSRQARSNAATFRNTGEYGADFRTHFYKTFDVSFDKLGIEVNQLRHIAQPVVRVEGTESSVNMERLTRFDTVDALDSSSQVILGLENRLQTKRVVGGKATRIDIVSLNTYLHYEMKPQDPTIGDHQFTILSNVLTLRPYEWLQYQAKADYDFARTYFKTLNQDLLIRNGPWKFILGYRFSHRQFDWYSEQMIATSQELVFDTRYKLNHLWEVGGYIRWDAKTRQMGEWQVSATRDLHDFILEFGYDVRDSWLNSNNRQLFFNFRMKAFPMLALKAGGRASFSEPRIGETVAGANEGAGRLGSPAMAPDSQLLSTL